MGRSKKKKTIKQHCVTSSRFVKHCELKKRKCVGVKRVRVNHHAKLGVSSQCDFFNILTQNSHAELDSKMCPNRFDGSDDGVVSITDCNAWGRTWTDFDLCLQSTITTLLQT